MSNEGQLPMLHNLLRSMKECGVDFSLLDVYLLQTNPNAARYGTKDFQSITIKKFECILKSMESGEDVLWVDNDIVFFSNPIPDLEKYCESIVIQNDGPQPCTGFMLLRNRDDVKQLLTKCIHMIHQVQHSNRVLTFLRVINDQDAFEKVWTPAISLIRLPRDTYPNGEAYVSLQPKNAIIFHNNYLHTTHEKIERFQKYGFWNPDPTLLETTKRIYIQ